MLVSSTVSAIRNAFQETGCSLQLRNDTVLLRKTQNDESVLGEISEVVEPAVEPAPLIATTTEVSSANEEELTALRSVKNGNKSVHSIVCLIYLKLCEIRIGNLLQLKETIEIGKILFLI